MQHESSVEVRQQRNLIDSKVKRALDYTLTVTNRTMEAAVSKGDFLEFHAIAQFLQKFSSRREIPAALLQTGLNVADHGHSFQQLQLSLKCMSMSNEIRRPSVVSVNSSDATTLDSLMSAGESFPSFPHPHLHPHPHVPHFPN
eukprot:COSAG05_NODE_5142_length_1254_cov_1.684848_2_plen_143_part_00